MEIQSEDVSLTVGLLDTVSTSMEDLQEKDVSDGGIMIPYTVDPGYGIPYRLVVRRMRL